MVEILQANTVGVFAVLFVLSALAVYYVTYALVYLDGLFGLIYKLRQVELLPFNCFFCTAFWVGLLFGLVGFGLSFNGLFIGLALAGVATLIEQATDHSL